MKRDSGWGPKGTEGAPASYIDTLSDGRVLVASHSLERLKGIDALIFDCDGVLVDTKGSYDRSVAKAVVLLLGRILDLELELELEEVLEGELVKATYELRKSGGFNNDWDSVYALVLLGLSLLGCEKIERALKIEPPSEPFARVEALAKGIELNYREKASWLQSFREALSSLKASPSNPSFSLIEERLVREIGLARVEGLSKILNYPEGGIDSPIARAMDEVYYGGELFERVHGEPPSFYHGRGLIEDERLLLEEEELLGLATLVGGKLGLATGRPYWAARYRLGGLLRHFKASFFIPDEIERLGKGSVEELNKPSPLALLRVAELLGSRRPLYIGDSTEDLLMAQRASHQLEVLFAGVLSYDPDWQLGFYASRGADLIVKDLKGLRAALGRVLG